MHRIVTDDEKCIHYDNPKCRKSWGKPSHALTSSAKPNNHSSKLLLCVWWDQEGVIYYELLKMYRFLDILKRRRFSDAELIYCQKDGRKWSLVMGNILIEMLLFLIRG